MRLLLLLGLHLLLLPVQMTTTAFLVMPSTVRSTQSRLPHASSVQQRHATRRQQRQQPDNDSTFHNNTEYTELVLTLPRIGPVILLEATLDMQTKLIDLALRQDEHDDNHATGSAIPATAIIINDVYGAVLWPAALTVACYLLRESETLLYNETVMEVGTGTGLVSLAAAMGGAHHVMATDYEAVPLSIVNAAAQRNQISNQVLSTRLFDICNVTQALPHDMTVLVAADILYEPKTGRALARRVQEALQLGAHVIVGDSPGRPGRPAFLQALKELGISGASFQNIKGWSVTGDRHELICGATSTTRTDCEKELVVAVMHLRPSEYRGD